MPLGGYVDRNAKFLELCRGKRVLHLGCVGFTDCPVEDKVRLARQSLHFALSEVCDCLGVDLDAESLRQLEKRGVFQNVMVGDVERLGLLPLGRESFDVVMAGDIIEHLSNPGMMLDGVRPLLKPRGLLVVSTPNAFGLPNYLRFLGRRFHEGQQHILCFNPVTLAQLLARHGYKVTAAFTGHQRAARRHGLFLNLGRLVFRECPRLGGTLLYVAEPIPQR